MLLIPFCQSFSRTESRTEIESRVSLAIQEFSRRLGIIKRIGFSVVPENSHLISVEHEKGGADGYRIFCSEAFLRNLNEHEMTAAIAHELGHVWIYTHFPFLQTESLANRQALRLVSRGDLESVYRKVWEWNGRKVSLAEVLKPVEEAVSLTSIQPVSKKSGTSLRTLIPNTAAPIVYLQMECGVTATKGSAGRIVSDPEQRRGGHPPAAAPASSPLPPSRASARQLGALAVCGKCRVPRLTARSR